MPELSCGLGVFIIFLFFVNTISQESEEVFLLTAGMNDRTQESLNVAPLTAVWGHSSSHGGRQKRNIWRPEADANVLRT